MKYIIGVDAGGTRTTAAAFDTDGKLIASEVGSFGNITVDLEEGAANICDTVERLCEKTKGECIYICPGIAGVETGNRRDVIDAMLRERFHSTVDILNDGQIASYAFFEGGDGVLCVAGTGSIVYGKLEDKFFRCGGYGTILGDEGSAYYLVIEALKKCFRRHDMGLDPSDMTLAFMKAMGASDNMHMLIEYLFSHNKGEIASFAPIVVARAEAGESEAVQVLEQAGQALGDDVILVVERMGLTAPSIAVSGSILQKVAPVTLALRQRVREAYPKAVFLPTQAYVPKGAYYRYMEKV